MNVARHHFEEGPVSSQPTAPSGDAYSLVLGSCTVGMVAGSGPLKCIYGEPPPVTLRLWRAIHGSKPWTEQLRSN